MCEGKATLESEVSRLRDMDIDDLRVLNKAVVSLINEKNNQRQKIIGASLYPGMTVKFPDKRIILTGIIRKVNVKTCGVDITAPDHRRGESWKVLNSLMEVVD